MKKTLYLMPKLAHQIILWCYSFVCTWGEGASELHKQQLRFSRVEIRNMIFRKLFPVYIARMQFYILVIKEFSGSIAYIHILTNLFYSQDVFNKGSCLQECLFVCHQCKQEQHKIISFCQSFGDAFSL